jgi:aldehyde dehydrogenase (NAD+)
MSELEENQPINEIYNAQRTYFQSGITLNIDFRIEQLKQLRKTVSINEVRICESIALDLGKPRFEAFITEIGIVLDEIDFHINNLKKWSKPKKVRGTLLNFPSQSRILQQPYGVSLIISPWNYPFQLLMMPLIGAISAGCTAVLKPSELSPNVSKIISELIIDTFITDYVAVIQGNANVSTQLLKLNFDKIFFTGSTKVGRIVMAEAASNLTPVTLELGGKSPAIIDQNCDMYTSAKRIWWGKCMNAGQTCVATDYVLVHENVLKDFVSASKLVLNEMFADGFKIGVNYSKIINSNHFDRLLGLLKDTEKVIDGEIDRGSLLIGPVLVTNVEWNHPLMQDEIFGPILPVLTYKDTDDLILQLRIQPNPLALYVFSKDDEFLNFVLNNMSFGGGCVNDTIGHLANPHLPFGGIGASGMGNYHGYNSFTCFSHEKSILYKTFWPDIPLRYPPYGNRINLMQWIFK